MNAFYWNLMKFTAMQSPIVSLGRVIDFEHFGEQEPDEIQTEITTCHIFPFFTTHDGLTAVLSDYKQVKQKRKEKKERRRKKKAKEEKNAKKVNCIHGRWTSTSKFSFLRTISYVLINKENCTEKRTSEILEICTNPKKKNLFVFP